MPHIDVAVTHSLGADKAFDKVLTGFTSQQGGGSRVTWSDVHINKPTHTITLKLQVADHEIDATITASDDLVHFVQTNDYPLTDLVGDAIVIGAQRQIRNMLTGFIA